MQRTLKRTIELTEEEVAEAILYWLTQVHDQPLGSAPNVIFAEHPNCNGFCNVKTHDVDKIET